MKRIKFLWWRFWFRAAYRMRRAYNGTTILKGCVIVHDLEGNTTYR